MGLTNPILIVPPPDDELALESPQAARAPEKAAPPSTTPPALSRSRREIPLCPFWSITGPLSSSVLTLVLAGGTPCTELPGGMLRARSIYLGQSLARGTGSVNEVRGVGRSGAAGRRRMPQRRLGDDLAGRVLTNLQRPDARAQALAGEVPEQRLVEDPVHLVREHFVDPIYAAPLGRWGWTFAGRARCAAALLVGAVIGAGAPTASGRSRRPARPSASATRR